jgi:hypothetical protein
MNTDALLQQPVRADLYQVNSFRLTGLAVDATSRDISRRLQLAQLQLRLGELADFVRPLPPASPFDRDVCVAAAERLRDPVTRLFDELFWFWPRPPAPVEASDDALGALALGDVEGARCRWRAWAEQGYAVARHNLAVLAHARALDLETLVPGGRAPADDAERQLRDTAWAEAQTEWAQVCKDEALWECLRRRVAARNEPQLPAAHTVAAIRDDLPRFLAGINAGLAVRAAESAGRAATRAAGRALSAASESAEARRARQQALDEDAARSADAERHRRLLASWPLDPCDVAASFRQAMRPVRQRIQGLCRGVEELQPTDYTKPAVENGQLALELFRRLYPMPTQQLDRDNLLEAAGAALQRFCWFCQRRVREVASSVGLNLYGRVTKRDTDQGQLIEYYHCAVDVPRCWHCAKYHRGYELPPGVRPLSDKASFPHLQRLLSEGWKIGLYPGSQD